MVGQDWRDRVIVGITGASGVIYGERLCQALTESGKEVHLILSSSGEQLLKMELGLDRQDLSGRVHRIYGNDEMTSQLSSGSHRFSSMVVVPSSMRTMAAIASGNSDNLICRVADVCLKERRKLVLVPRETPLGLSHIRSMEELTLAGAVILPAMPAFYHRPSEISDMVSFIVGKILDQLEIEHDLFTRWSGAERRQGS